MNRPYPEFLRILRTAYKSETFLSVSSHPIDEEWID
jgi:hypothetical protein